MSSKNIICLDVGEKRIGIAVADTSVRIAMPYETIDVDGGEIDDISKLVDVQKPKVVVIGYPRNQSGEPTKQTKKVEEFASMLEPLGVTIVFQDESLTSVAAEERLKSHGRPYAKADIDAQAATIILQDYLEQV
jgi:putative Holliday junction resolvase